MSPSRLETVQDAGQETHAYGQGGFETLMASIARRLLGERLESFDSAVTDALTRLIQILDVDRSTFGVVGPDGILRATLAVAAPGLAPVPIGRPIEEIVPSSRTSSGLTFSACSRPAAREGQMENPA